MHPKEFIINFHFQRPVTLRDRKALKQFISKQLLKSKRTGAEVNIVFVSDADLLEINRTHLNHDYYTDIITFDLSEPRSSVLISDIYISVDRVKDNASLEGVSVTKELHRVIFHGLLHLSGYKDKSERDQKLMRTMEDRWLKSYFG